jgi:hypothetical protein
MLLTSTGIYQSINVLHPHFMKALTAHQSPQQQIITTQQQKKTAAIKEKTKNIHNV